jgi:hypothetical protein
MQTEVFANPDLEAMDNAHLDGLLNWHRRDRTNPYEVAFEIMSDGMWYAWDSGRRLGVFLHEVRKAALTESDRVNADTLRRLRAAGIKSIF